MASHAPSHPDPRPATDTAEPVSIDWRWLILRGGLALVTGIAALLFPDGALRTFTLVLGVYAAADGLAAFASGRGATRSPGSLRPYMFRAIVGVLAGLSFFAAPRMTLPSQIFPTLAIASTWAALAGLLEIVAVLTRNAGAKGFGLLVIAGMVSIVLALAMPVTLFFHPGESLAAISGVIGLFLCAIGGLYALEARRLRPSTGKILQ